METENLTFAELPHSVEAEQAVLGSILSDREKITDALSILKAEHFYISRHKQLFEICVRQFTVGSDTDVVTVLNEAVALKVFENDTAGREYLLRIREMVTPGTSIDTYCKIVLNKFYFRQLISASKTISEAAFSGADTADDVIDAAERLIYDIRNGRDVSGLTKISDILVDAYNTISQKVGAEREKYRAGTTGYGDLDRIITGLNRSDLLILAARPGMGKSALALNIAVNYARHNSDKEVVYFSLEMSNEQLALRMLASESHVESRKLLTGELDGADVTNLAEGVNNLTSLNMYFDDNAGVTVPQMKAKLRRLPQVGLVIIDYLQLMSSGKKNENRVVEISEITRQLKVMAKELNVPVITLSQLSRGVESRQDKRPILSDLRESGSIEQDADIVMFIYREGYYNKQTENPNMTEILVAKNRHGETGMVNLFWNGQYTLFLGMDRN
ncbi:MAG: replicative DNA helicase [Ruminococcus sp.]|jgi:replicative DNA helicase|nr:replicative DNA helicase [Ruminococcus sp.]